MWEIYCCYWQKYVIGMNFTCWNLLETMTLCCYVAPFMCQTSVIPWKTRHAMNVYRNIEARSYYHRRSAKTLLHILSVYFSLRYQQGMRTYCIILSSVACPILQNFFTLSHKQYDFRNKITEHKCVLIFSTNWSETPPFLRTTERDMYSTSYWSHIVMNRSLSRQIFEKHSNVKFHENPSSGSRAVPCGQTNGRTDIHEEANSHFSQFCERAWKTFQVSQCSSSW